MTNNDLTRFNLLAANFYISTKTVKNDVDDFHWVVVIYNFEDDCAFELPHKFNCPTACNELASKLFDAKVVNLILWNYSDFLTYTQRSDIIDGFVDCLSYDDINCRHDEQEDDLAAEQAINAAIDLDFHDAAVARSNLEFYGRC